MVNENIDELNHKAWNLRYENHEQALKIASEALERAEKKSYQKGKIYALLNKSIIEILLSKLDSVLNNLFDVKSYFENVNDKLGLTRSLYALADLYKVFGDYEKAMNYCSASEKLALADCQDELGEIYNIKGSIYIGLCDFEHAVEAFEKSLENRKENDLKGRASTLNRLGWANVERASISTNKNEKSGLFALALKHYREAIDLRKKVSDITGLPFSYFGLANLYEKKGDFKKAEETYLVCKDFNEKNSKDKFCDLKCNLALGKVILIQNKEGALDFLTKAKIIADSISTKYFQCEINKFFSEYYEKENNYELAHKYFKAYNKLKSEIINTENQNKAKYQQIKIISEKNSELEKKNKLIEESVKAAYSIQSAILPIEEEMKKVFSDFFILFKPRDIVSGDFYWFKQFNNKAIIAAADCTGHGIPGAFMCMLGAAFLNEIIQEDNLSPNKILNALRTKIKTSLKQTGKTGEEKGGMDMALCLIDVESGKVEYSGAYNPLIRIRNKELVEIKADRMPVAIYPREDDFKNNMIKVKKGDRLYIFSDGYHDQLGGERIKKYSGKKFKELLLEISEKTMKVQKELLEKEHLEWKRNQDQTDDILVIGMEI